MLALIALLFALAQLPAPIPAGSGSAPIVSPRITFTTPAPDSVYATSVATQPIGGSVTAGSAAISGVSLTCTGATVLGATSVAGAGATSWTRTQTFSQGTTVCTATVTDVNGGTAVVSKTFVVTFPDVSDPIVNAGPDRSTADATIQLSVTCFDDVGCVAVTWTSSAGSGTCTASGGFNSDSYNCTYTLAVGVNTITVTGRDQAGRTGTDVVVITRASDSGSPTVAAGADDTTASSSYTRLGVTCADDTGCVSVTWSGIGGSGPCTISGSGPSVSADCTFTLGTTGGLTTVNTITVTGTDAANNSGSDTVAITRTVALAVTTSTLPNCSKSVACTLPALTATGGTTGTYTWDTNGAGSGSSLNTGDADCAGLSMSAGGVISGTATTAAALPATCSFTARVNDTVTTATKALTVLIVDAAATTYFQQVSALDAAQVITECVAPGGDASKGDAKGCSLRTMEQLNAVADANDAADANRLSGYSIDSTTLGMPVARLEWHKKDPSVGRNLRFYIGIGGPSSTADVTVIWDDYKTASWTKASCGLGGVVRDITDGAQHKEDQLQMGAQITSGRIEFETRSSYRLAGKTCADANITDIRTYSDGPQTNAQLAITNETSFAAGPLSDAGPGTAQHDTVHTPHSEVVRHIKRVQLGKTEADFSAWNTYYAGFNGFTAVPAGRYAMISEWQGTKSGGWVTIMKNVPLRVGFQNKNFAVTSLTCSGGTMNISTGTTAHKVGQGETFFVYGADQTTYNGVFIADSVTTTDITASGVTCGASPATGTITTGSALMYIADFFFEHNTSSNHTQASGSVTLTGPDGTVIPQGSSVQISHTFEGTTITSSYTTQASVTLAGGTGTVTIKAVNDVTGTFPTYLSAGDAGNAPAGASVTLPSFGSVTGTVGSSGISGGQYINLGSLIMLERWVNVLVGIGDPTLNATVWQLPL